MRNGTGTVISSETQVGGFPVYPTTPPPPDSDSDGMPNTWESEHGLNPASALDANADRNGDGYLNIEEYINSLIEPQATTANAGPDQELCGSTTTTLAANTPLVGLGSWTVISGGGTVTAPNNQASTVTNMQIGVNVLSWRISYDGSITRDTVRINVLQPTTPANAGSDQQICSGVPATLHGNVPAVGTGIWRTIDGPGIVTAPSNPNSGVTNLRLGFNVFEWKITGPLVCPEYRDTVSIFVDNLPTIANAGGDRTLCSVSSTSLSGNQPRTGQVFGECCQVPEFR